MDEAEKNHNALFMSYKELCILYDSAKHSKEEAVSELREGLNSLNNKVIELSNMNSALTHQLQETSEALKLEKEECSALREQCTLTAVEMTQVRDNYESLLSQRQLFEKEAVQKDLEELKRNFQSLQNEREGLLLRIRDYKSAMSQNSEHIDGLEKKIKNARSIIENLDTSLNCSRESEVNLKKENRELQEQLLHHRNQLGNFTKENEKLLIEITNLKAEKETLKQKLNELKRKSDDIIKELQKTLENEKELIVKLKNENEAVKKIMHDTLSIQADYVLQNQHLQMELASFKEKRQTEIVWEEDESVTFCRNCESRFTTFRRKHHCRTCGKVICHMCSQNTIIHPDTLKEVRVCDKCYENRNMLAVQLDLSSSSQPPISATQTPSHSRITVSSLSSFEKTLSPGYSSFARED
ncbi:RUN and FYVE domain-containing protein 2-like [Zophobas morio]|uniref:RUN and FYVE domain-containing protein 2-like n=1 Tax=Zophobas morio TaxID=2755281 RepID=UPI0030833451